MSITALSTVNSKFISFYNDLSPIWWNLDGEINFLHSLNKLRIPWILNALEEYKVIAKDAAKSEKPLQNLSILDVGCGGGCVSEILALMGGIVVGIDPTPKLIDVAKEHAAHKFEPSSITYICESIEEHSKNNHGKYDIVIASQVMAYLDEHKLFLNKCVECVKPGGIIFVSSQCKTWTSWLFFKIMVYIKNFPRGIIDYEKFSRPEEIEKWLVESNCKTSKPAGITYNGFSHTWMWSNFASFLFAIHGKKAENN